MQRRHFLLTAAGAAAARAARSGSAPEGELAIRWLHRRFEQACDAARAGAATELAMIEPVAAEKLVEAYAEAIGDVEQRLPGARELRDPLLRRDPTAD